MNNGRVYWITGLSNSGKTTIGTALYYKLKKSRNNVVILDGDLIKAIASGTRKAEYDNTERYVRALRYSNLSKLLADQGIWVIVCAIAMFDEIREWNRKHIKGYYEVFLDAPEEVLRKRDKKGLYSQDPDIQLPKNPDLKLVNDGSVSIQSLVDQILLGIPQNEEDFDRDREYWNKYYENIKNQNIVPSGFAVVVNERLADNSHVLELGCGNGRDSLYFIEKGHRVTAIDASDLAIDNLNGLTADNDNALFVCDDFVKCRALYQMKYDCIYSRFTLHAITEEQEDELLSNVKEALNPDVGIFCIEARTTKDEIFGKGQEVAHNAYIYNEHFRRFLDVNEFREKLQKLGFRIESIEEAQGFSKTADSDPVLMRVVATLA